MMNKFVLSLIHRLSIRRCPHSSLSAGACSTATAAHPHVSWLQNVRQQTRRPPLLLSIDETDGRADAGPLHRPCSA